MTSSTVPGRDPARPLRRDAQRNRERILAAARELFATEGTEPGLDAVAHAADVGVGTVYRHFPTKDALVDELFTETIDGITVVAAALCDEPDSWAAFTGLVEHLAAASAANRALKALFRHPDHGQRRAAHARERLAEPVIAIVERAKADGHLAPDFAPADVGSIHTMLTAVIDETESEQPDLWRRSFGLVMDGLASQARAARG